ncbi:MULTISPECIES: MarR family winged helix-turn-helix transcriptional regulator [unclassified Arthrobacter]|uniref:MarR family winged helix-turn-helix transcriptional regulator n=1 Tax=unclassified Arthrobacter TaxID=235627 RepID=UPI001D13C086|nr:MULTISPECIES: helix-turn-helix domain-containing protein [unclassified Arthrobacter]MCC3289740.1 MarR family transcriptional regulator [Arthrobacter sp. zg-Y1110]MCC3300745.1 MarR family transcriptional regulator [Arthrobacter sp. zg-Y895]UWX84841.1 MarR family transcriptional regulator [Arthrobacter sp. zg-Y1110]
MTNDGAPAATREIADLLRDLSWNIHRKAPEITGIEPLPNTELAVLKHVLDNPGLTVTELARLMGLKQSNASAAVRTLAERGLVTRSGSPTDRRVSLLLPTEEARAQNEVIAHAWAGPIRAGIERLTVEQREALAAASEALVALNRAMQSRG